MIATSAVVGAVGFHWGPRLLLPAVAVLAVRGFAALHDALARTGGTPRRVLAVLALLCIALGIADSAVYLDRLRLKARLGQELERAIRGAAPPGTPILTNTWWLAFDLPLVYLDYPMLGAREPSRALPAVAAARKLSPDTALLVASDDPSSTPLGWSRRLILSRADSRRLDLADKVWFPDGFFHVGIHKLQWRDTPTSAPQPGR
jgi:hypothetical protein